MASVLKQVRNEFTKLNDETTDDDRMTRLKKELELPDSRRNRDRVQSSAAPAVTPGMEDIMILPNAPTIKQQNLTLRQKIWKTFEDPTSSRLASLLAFFIVAMIATSVTAFIVQTLPEYIWSTDPAWSAVEITCITVFTVEFLLRIVCCPSIFQFLKAPLNLIDLLAILPFYIEVIVPGSGGSSSATIIRVIRLVRIFRIFKVARYLPWVRVFANAMRLSFQPLLMLVFVVLIAMTVFASGMYYVERGEWDAGAQAFMRTVNGEKSVSPFQSIPSSMWWAIITMTTVGYGDVYPVTSGGKFIAAIAALCGILVIAIPVTIISTNFNGEYAEMQREREKVKARMLLLRHHFKARKAGLDAVLDEVEDLVRRNTQEFASEVDSLFEQSRAELTEEIQEIVRMAFERRRQLHLAALAAGRVQGSLTADAVKEEVNFN